MNGNCNQIFIDQSVDSSDSCVIECLWYIFLEYQMTYQIPSEDNNYNLLANIGQSIIKVPIYLCIANDKGTAL